MPLFSRPRSPAEIVRNLKEALGTLERGGDAKKQEKVRKSSSEIMINLLVRPRRKSASNEVLEDSEEIRKRRSFLQV